jgi:alkylhydroperoxidase family enzyme
VPRIDPATDVKGPLIAKMLGRRPEVLEGFLALDRAFRDSGLLGPHLLEMIRRTTAQHAGCDYCASLGVAREPSDPRTEAALDFAHAVVHCADTQDEALVDRLRPHFTEEEIVELVAWTCMVCIGGQRFGAVLGLESASAAEAVRYERWALG